MLLLWLLPLAGQEQVPSLRTVGVHRLDMAGRKAQWLGPGGDPAWSADGRKLYVQAHQAPLGKPALGPLYSIAVPSGAADALRDKDGLGLVKVSPSGRYLAVVDNSALPAIILVDARTGELAGPPTPIGPVTEDTVDVFGWSPTIDRLWVAGRDGGLVSVLPGQSGVPLVALLGLDAVWPAPDGEQLAVRVDGELRLIRAEDPAAAATVVVPADPETPIQACWWTAASDGLWVETVEDRARWVKRFAASGGPADAGWPLPGEVVSRLGHRDDAVVYVATAGVESGVVKVDLATGAPSTVARIDPAVPLRTDPNWRLAAPAPRPGAADEWAVTLGRTDRWGVSELDKTEFTDVDISGKTVRVVRRGRNVGPSGVVFDARETAFLGRKAPVAESSVVGDVRPGTMRWARPSPARWVVLHHTASRSDSGCLNALTSPSSGKLAQLYADITPGSWMPAEPRTIGVHYLVLRSGTVLQLAEETTITRHAGTGQWANAGPVYDFNSETIGIEIVAEGNDFTAGQVRNVGRLVADICRRNSIQLEHINGRKFVEGVLYHKDFAAGLRGKPDPAGWPWSTMLQHAQAFLAGR